MKVYRRACFCCCCWCPGFGMRLKAPPPLFSSLSFLLPVIIPACFIPSSQRRLQRALNEEQCCQPRERKRRHFNAQNVKSPLLVSRRRRIWAGPTEYIRKRVDGTKFFARASGRIRLTPSSSLSGREIPSRHLKTFFLLPFSCTVFLWKNERDFEVGKILFLAKDSSGFDVSVFYRQCSTS